MGRDDFWRHGERGGIQFNEDTLWHGKPHRLMFAGALEALQNPPPSSSKVTPVKRGNSPKKVRSVIRCGNCSYQPFAVRLTFRATKRDEYRCELDLDSRHRDRELQGW